MMDFRNRSAHGCLCCGSARLDGEPTLTSLFLSRMAWNGPPEPTIVHRCLDCDFRFHDRGLSAAEVAAYYGRYRDGNYLRERHADEPFYTAKLHRQLDAVHESRGRRERLAAILNEVAVTNCRSVIDYGGGDGVLISGLTATRKAVCDLAPHAPVAGIERLTPEEAGGDWDLAVCAQMLEHVSDPEAHMRRLLSLVRPGGHIFVEVPNEHWKSYSCRGAIRNAVLRLIARRRWSFILMDVYSTAFRVKLGFLPPFGFVPTREHLNYFSRRALEALATRAGGEVLFSLFEPEVGFAVVRRPG